MRSRWWWIGLLAVSAWGQEEENWTPPGKNCLPGNKPGDLTCYQSGTVSFKSPPLTKSYLTVDDPYLYGNNIAIIRNQAGAPLVFCNISKQRCWVLELPPQTPEGK